METTAKAIIDAIARYYQDPEQCPLNPLECVDEHSKSTIGVGKESRGNAKRVVRCREADRGR